MKSRRTIKTAEALTGTTTTQATSYVCDSAVLRQTYLSRLLKGEAINLTYGPGCFHWNSFLLWVILSSDLQQVSNMGYVLLTVTG